MHASDRDYLELQERYFSDLEGILWSESKLGKSRIVLLSGGVDSLLIVAILNKLFPEEMLYTVTIRGSDTEDSDGAETVADHFMTEHLVVNINVEDLIDNLPLVQGCQYDKLSRVMSHICYSIALDRMQVTDAYVYSGHGADILYGNKKRIYEGAEEIALDAGLSLEEVKTDIKDKYYASYRIAGQHLARIISNKGAHSILPYLDRRLSYLSKVPFSIISPFDKKFIKEGMARRYGLANLVDRASVGMQTGTGLYQSFRLRMKQQYRHIHRSSRVIASYLSSERKSK